ncbi:MAG TPA: TIGR04086 family membrane protein [Bacillales bacterium]|nr:TIGR04086 family membrane protein [Bacillales bacterium]
MRRSMFFGLGTIVAIVIASSLVISILLRFTKLSEASFGTATTVISLLALLIGGVVAGKKAHQRGWIIGAGTGLLYTFLIFLIQFLGYETGFTPRQYLYFLMYILVAALGGMAGVNLSPGTRKK